jgi:hypothetical protein
MITDEKAVIKSFKIEKQLVEDKPPQILIKRDVLQQQ